MIGRDHKLQDIVSSLQSQGEISLIENLQMLRAGLSRKLD